MATRRRSRFWSKHLLCSANVLAVSKLEDGQAVVLVQLLVNDAPVTQPVRYLYVFEDGRWLDNECPAR